MTQAPVIWNLAKVMMIKDEGVCLDDVHEPGRNIGVIGGGFNVNPANGDKITYLHLNRPEFVIGGKKIRVPSGRGGTGS